MAMFFKFKPRDRDQAETKEKQTKTKWISVSGLLSGASSVISSVFASDSHPSDSDSDSDSEPLPLPLPQDHTHHPNFIQQQGLQDPITIIPPQTNSKLTIHHLITNQTFSREESDKLIKLLESRVFEASSPYKQQNDMHNYNVDHTPFSPVQSSSEMCTAAVAEAKKWFDEKKKTGSSSSKTTDLVPSKLSTDMSQFEIESDIGSPVDLAKSYMLSKPPWQSPFLPSPSTLFGTPLSKFSADAIHGTFDHTLSSSRFLKRDYISTGLWDPKEESSRRVRSRLSGSAFDSLSSFIRPNSSSRLFDRDILESEKNLNSNLVEGKEPSNPDDVPSLQAGTADRVLDASDSTLGNNAPLQCAEGQKNADITTDISVDLNKAIEGIPEMVNLEMSSATVPALSEKNNAADQDQKILIDDQAALEGNKGPQEPENLSDPKPHEGDLHITNSLHGSTNKNSANGPAVQSNMESEFESSINGEPTSSTAGPDISDDKSLNGSGIHTGSKNSEPGTSPIRKGRKRVVSGRGRGRGRGRVRGT
ncbi:flocculation protein [Rhynchospora pubera]|uniref:Flocculation protein n=1 Tax=Rhynchospora pubera TaxID=906938 RepID=A0AAV8HD58_9POAL|nr:flocculation protein [Rhynchospora pubera]